MKAAFYLRVSTSEQDTSNQRLELEKVAATRGWTIAHVYEDFGISGAKGRGQRPALDSMLKDAVRGKFDLIAAWSVDRLGRSLADLVQLLNDLHAAGVGLYLHQQALDTTTPSGRAMFQMIGVFAEFERAMIRERINAGLARTRAEGTVLGRPPAVPKELQEEFLARLQVEDKTIPQLAKEMGIARSTAYRLTAN